MDPPLIELRDVTFRYPGGASSRQRQADGRPALDGVTVAFHRGEYVVLLGHNGSGKSTLARLTNGLLLPTQGRVLVSGLDTRLPPARRRIRELVGMIFSDPDNQIIATLVEDDVAWGPAARGWPLDQIKERVDQALCTVGLERVRGQPPSLLSGGQRQRLAIAGVLALQPDCIVADEPTALLDPQARSEMATLLHELCRNQGLTIVHATHLLEEAYLADRVIVLDLGRITLTGTPGEVFSDLGRLRRLRLNVPEVALLGERLRSLGVEVPAAALSPEALVEALSKQNQPAGGQS